MIDWENHGHLDIFTLSVSLLSSTTLITSLDSSRKLQEYIYAADGGQDYRKQCSIADEPLIQTMMPHPEQAEAHHPWEPHPNYLDEPFTITLRSTGKGALSAYELWKLHKRKREIQKEQLDHWQNTINRTGTGRPVDALLSPVAPFAAPPHGLNR